MAGQSDVETPDVTGDSEFTEFARQAFVTGAAITIPAIVTLFVLGFVVNFVSSALNPVVGVAESVFGLSNTSDLAVKTLAFVTVVAAIFVTGAVAERRPGDAEVRTVFNAAIARIPGIGSLYRSIDEMSNLLLDSDTQSFREVRLVEFPNEGAYAVAFLTAETPDSVTDATPHEEMETLFLPMAPNPVMGGYVIHVDRERVYDVDLTVEEGIQSIVTSGVATGTTDEAELSEGVVERIERTVGVDELVDFQRIGQYASDASSQLDVTSRRARERMEGLESRVRREDSAATATDVPVWTSDESDATAGEGRDADVPDDDADEDGEDGPGDAETDDPGTDGPA